VLTAQIDELRSLARVVDNLVILCTRRANVEAYEKFDISKEAHIRIERERRRAERDSVEIALVESGKLELEGDREAIMLALGNLVENAVYWSLPGDRVVVDLKGCKEAVEITVDDSGPGVPESEREQIFEAFFQGAAKSREHRIGYGLGLALTQEAVASHGGKVWVEDSPHGGARFRVSLPRREKKKAS
jgi:signal transduction histidine kinase